MSRVVVSVVVWIETVVVWIGDETFCPPVYS